METGKKVLMAAAALVLLGAVQVFAQETRPEIIIANGLGAEITELILSPAKDQYAKNRNRYAHALQENDKAVFSVEIPDHLLRYESFDIEVTAGGKRFVTRHGVKLDREKGIPLLELSETGKDSTIALIAGLGAATGTIVFLTATPAGRQILATTVMSLYRWKGIATILSYPTLGGAAGYLAGRAFTPKGLYVQLAYIN